VSGRRSIEPSGAGRFDGIHRECDDIGAGNHRDAVTRLGMKDVKAGEFAEGGEDKARWVRVKARKTLTLAPVSPQHDAGVKVSAHDVSVLGWTRVVLKTEGILDQRPVVLGNIEVGRGEAGIPVMIAADEDDVYTTMIGSPCTQCRQGAVRHARSSMVQVAQHQ
jgi:uncharacterized protein (UPF0548 family)